MYTSLNENGSLVWVSYSVFSDIGVCQFQQILAALNVHSQLISKNRPCLASQWNHRGKP